MIAVHGGYTAQYFEEGEKGHIYEIGCGISPIEPLQINFEFDNNQGYNGSNNGFVLDAFYDVTKALQVSGGLAYDVYQRDGMANNEIARVYWLGGKYRLAKNMAASLRVENNVNEQYHNDTQGRFVFDYDF